MTANQRRSQATYAGLVDVMQVFYPLINIIDYTLVDLPLNVLHPLMHSAGVQHAAALRDKLIKMWTKLNQAYDNGEDDLSTINEYVDIINGMVQTIKEHETAVEKIYKARVRKRHNQNNDIDTFDAYLKKLKQVSPVRFNLIDSLKARLRFGG